jgi:hypothetical protein
MNSSSTGGALGTPSMSGAGTTLRVLCGRAGTAATLTLQQSPPGRLSVPPRVDHQSFEPEGSIPIPSIKVLRDGACGLHARSQGRARHANFGSSV